jgi:CheY-like chemotaxis protein
VAKITIIDDDADQAADVGALLGTAGHKVTIITRMTGALACLAAEPPDLLILDVMFPQDPSAGMELAIAIRRTPELKELPVILLTSVNQEFPLHLSNKDIDSEWLPIQWLPIQEFMEKPIDPPALIAKVDELLKKAGRQ